MTDRTPTERLVAQVWAELLGLDGSDGIGPDDDFFDIGGSSLMLVRLAARLSAASGTEVELLSLFSATTVRAQATLVGSSSAPAGALPPITPLTRPGEPR